MWKFEGRTVQVGGKLSAKARSMPDVFKEQQLGQCGCSKVTETMVRN